MIECKKTEERLKRKNEIGVDKDLQSLNLDADAFVASGMIRRYERSVIYDS